MKMNSAIDDFLQSKNQKSEAEYRRKLEIFHVYLKDSLDCSDSNFCMIVDALKEKHIEDSVKYYINRKGRKKISSCSPVHVFNSAVFEYLKFLYEDEKYDIGNSLFIDEQKKSEIRLSVDLYMKQLGLKESESENHLSPEECKELIDKCNQYIDVSLDTLISDDAYNKNYTKFLSAILIKLILIFGISRETINSLKLNDYDSELGCITINGCTVRIPNTLTIQMRKYLRVRDAIVVERDKERLFVRRYSQTGKRGNQSSELDSATICVVLNEITGTSSVVSVAKTAIISMIRNGAPQHLIISFTGNKKDIYEYCLDIVDDDSFDADNRRLDITFRSSELFDML